MRRPFSIRTAVFLAIPLAFACAACGGDPQFAAAAQDASDIAKDIDGRPPGQEETFTGPEAGPCADGNACTLDQPQDGGCVHSQRPCFDQSSCTADGCDPLKGCTFLSLSCSDDNPCTNDSCSPTLGCQSFPRNCDDGNPCTVDSCAPKAVDDACQHQPIDGALPCHHLGVIGICDNSECVPAPCDAKNQVPWTRIVPGSSTATALAVMPLATGGVALGGVDTAKPLPRARLVLTDSAGQVSADWHATAGDESKGSAIRHVLPGPGQGVLVVGTIGSGFEVRAFASAWTAQSRDLLPLGLPMQELQRAVAAVGGGAWLCGQATSPAPLKSAWVGRVSALGQHLWVLTLNAKQVQNCATMTALPGGDAVAGVIAPNSGPYGGQSTLVRVSSDGQLLWEAPLLPAGTVVRQVFADADGSILAFASGPATAKAGASVLLRYSAAGAFLSDQVLQVQNYGHLVAAIPSGYWNVTQVKAPGQKQSARHFQRLDAQGQLLWSRTAQIPGFPPYAVVAAADGGLLLAGAVPTPTYQFWLAHADRWGYSSCTEAGQCLGLVCEDGDPCTVDDCSAATGCAKPGAPDGWACGPAQTCQSGVCAPP